MHVHVTEEVINLWSFCRGVSFVRINLKRFLLSLVLIFFFFKVSYFP